MSHEKVKASVYTPMKTPHLRNGKGFSIEEIRKAGLSLHTAKRLGVSIDKRRKTLHPQNVQRLKEDFGRIIKLTEIKGIGATAEKKLIELDILDAYDFINANLNELSKTVSYSRNTLKKWQNEAKKLLNK